MLAQHVGQLLRSIRCNPITLDSAKGVDSPGRHLDIGPKFRFFPTILMSLSAAAVVSGIFTTSFIAMAYAPRRGGNRTHVLFGSVIHVLLCVFLRSQQFCSRS